MIWLPSPLTAPFPVIPRLILVLVGSVAFFSGMMISFVILQISLFYEESEKLTVLDEAFDQDP
jgi:hypothetical protein